MKLSTEQMLLLNAALAKPDTAVQSFNLWWKQVDIDADVHESEYRLLPLVYHNIGRTIEDPVAAARVRGVAKHVWLNNHRNAALCTTLLDKLIAAGVPTVLLKGAAMMLMVSGENLRSLNDCDLLIPIEAAPQFIADLAKSGYNAIYQDVRRFTEADFRLLHGVSLAPPGNPNQPSPGDDYQPFDIHWRPFREVRAEELTREIFDASTAMALFGRRTRCPCYEHMVLHTMVHGTDWADSPRYDWIADVVLILRKVGPEFSWERMFATANRFGLSEIVRRAVDDLGPFLDDRDTCRRSPAARHWPNDRSLGSKLAGHRSRDSCR